jgi:tetratricopeptide (TPR) repeat protein
VDYTEAIRLDPTEPIYYQNFATTVYLYRTDVKEFYHINEQQTFDKALGLYRQAMKLAPDDLVLATDYAVNYYGIRPLRTNDALMAWTNALKIAKDDNEREGVIIHLARIKIAAGMYDEAQAHINTITNVAYADLKHRLERSLADHKSGKMSSTEDDTTIHAAATKDASSPATNGIPVSHPASPQ